MVQRRAGKRLQTCLVLAGVVAGATLTACSNGVEAGTLDPPSATGVGLDVGDLRLRNAVIVHAESGELTLSMTVVNTGSIEDAMTAVTVTGETEAVAAQLKPRSIALAPGAATVLPSESGPTVTVEADLVAGAYVPVSIQFESAGLVELSLPVISPDSPYGSSGDEGSTT